MIARVLVVVSLNLVACEPTDPDATEPTDRAGATEGPDSTESGPSIVATPVHTSDDALTSCNALCGGFESTCDTTCPDIGLGTASYAWTDYKTFFTYFDQLTLETCDQAAPLERPIDGETYERQSLLCCCALPEITEVAGSIESPRACDDVCADEGTVCAEYPYWSQERASGGMLATYKLGTSTFLYQVLACDEVPNGSTSNSAGRFDLEAIACGCQPE